LSRVDAYPKSHYLTGKPDITGDPMNTDKPKKEGRLELRVDPEWLAVVDDLRREERDIPTRAEFIRRLALRERDRRQIAA
jgi:hypothetical protein